MMSVLEKIYIELLNEKNVRKDYSVKAILLPDSRILRRDNEKESYLEIDDVSKVIVVLLCMRGVDPRESENINAFLKELGLAILIVNECDTLDVDTYMYYIEYKMSVMYRLFLNILYKIYGTDTKVIYSQTGKDVAINDKRLSKSLEEKPIYRVAKPIAFTKGFISASKDKLISSLIEIVKSGSKPNLFIANNVSDNAYDIDEFVRNGIKEYLSGEEDLIEEEYIHECLFGSSNDIVPCVYDSFFSIYKKTEESSREVHKIGQGICSLANKDAVVFGPLWKGSLYTRIIHYIAHKYLSSKIVVFDLRD